MKKRIWALALTAVFLLTACSGGESTTGDFSVTAGEDAQTAAASGLTLSMRVPETLNPLRNRDESVDRILKLMFLPFIGQGGKRKTGRWRCGKLDAFSRWYELGGKSEAKHQMDRWYQPDCR